MRANSFDVTVIGAGPGGYVAAIRAAQRGKRVALIERSRLGGVCLNWGCIPTKALLRIAERYEFLKEASDWGFGIGEVTIQWDRVIEKSRAAAERLSRGVGYLMKKNQVDVFHGAGRFASPNRIVVTESGGRVSEIQTTHAVIATGGRPAVLPGVEVDGEVVVTSKEAMVLPERPESLIVVGAGAVGLEFAYFYSVFGTKVDLIEYCPTVLPGGDREICEFLGRSFQKRGIRLHTSTKVVGATSDGGTARVTVEHEGETSTLEAEAALIAVGFRANVEGLGLEHIGVRLDRGFISVDAYGETNVSGVYAIGDVIGVPMLAHAASAEAIHVIGHICGDPPAALNYRNVPACIYCYPQVAAVGMTEEEAREAGHDVKVGKFPFTANGKAVAVGEVEGFVKIVAGEESGEILGVHIVGPEATELIGEVALARSAELTVDDVHRAVHSHPTLSESLMEAAADWAGEAIHI